jgi:hypothetical protein
MVFTKGYTAPEVDRKEVLRYARAEGDETTLALLESCIAEAKDRFSYNVCYARFGIEIHGDEIDLGFTRTSSHSLAKCLDGCHEIVLLAATVGFGIDRLIEKYSFISPSRAVIFQALGSERVEALCDAFCNDLATEEERSGNTLRPRFSPGYGDLPLELQRDIFASLGCTRAIGITLGDNLFMNPTKSVTAIIGIKGIRNENS